MQLVSKDAIMLTPKCTQKLLIIGPHFLRTGLAAQTAHKQKSHTTKCPLMQNWVFRLRCFLYLVQIFGCSFPSPQSLKHLSKNDIAALCEKMNDSAIFLDKQTITIHIPQRIEMYTLYFFLKIIVSASFDFNNILFFFSTSRELALLQM